MGIRCKMRCDGVYAQTWGGAKVIFRCCYDDDLSKECREFAKATPNGCAEFEVSNPDAASQLIIGEYYYVDFNRVLGKKSD